MSTTEHPAAAAWKRETEKQLGVIIVGGELHAQVDALHQALIDNPGFNIYQRGGGLVEIVFIPSKNNSEKISPADGTTSIVYVSATRLRDKGTRHAIWSKYDERMKGYKYVDCPKDVSETLLARNEWKDVRVLNCIQHCPTILPDGTLIMQPGYNSALGIFFWFDAWLQLEDEPSLAGAQKALEFLENWISEIPFRDDASRSCYLASIFTGIIRGQLSSAPIFAIDSSIAGAGKTLLAIGSSLVLNGYPPAVITQPREDSEARKVIFSALSAGDPIIVVDNVRQFGGDVWCAITTSDTYRDRLLGQSKMISVSTRVLIYITGINPVYYADVVRRLLNIRLEPATERPEERTFKKDFKTWTLGNRQSLINAAMIIMRAHILAGSPDCGLKPFGGFEEWSSRVRAPLVWSGATDPCETRARVEAIDPDREQLGTLLDAWWHDYQDNEVLVNQFISDAASGKCSDEFRDIAHAIAPDGTRINSRKLGKKISAWEGRVCDGLKIIRGSMFRRAQRWKLQKLDGVSFESNESYSITNIGNCQTNTEHTATDTHTNAQTHTAITEACTGLSITPEELLQKFSSDDIADIESGRMTADDLLTWAQHYSMLHVEQSDK